MTSSKTTKVNNRSTIVPSTAIKKVGFVEDPGVKICVMKAELGVFESPPKLFVEAIGEMFVGSSTFMRLVLAYTIIKKPMQEYFYRVNYTTTKKPK